MVFSNYTHCTFSFGVSVRPPTMADRSHEIGHARIKDYGEYYAT